MLKSKSSKAVGPKVQNIDIVPGFQGSAHKNNTGSNIADNIDYKIQQKKLKNKFLEEIDSDFMSDFSPVETNVTVQPSFPAEVQEKELKNEILEDDDDDIPDDFDFPAVETNVTVQPSSPAEEPEPIKQFKKISHKKEGNYYILKCLLPSFNSSMAYVLITQFCDIPF